MKVYVPGPLRSYTGNRSMVEAVGGTVADVLQDLEKRFPGMRFRMIDEQDRVRQHIRLFVNQEVTFDLSMKVKPDDEIQIICSISGGNGRRIIAVKLSEVRYNFFRFQTIKGVERGGRHGHSG
jgi:molybdopterin synthase sulfur carrier subunit